MIIPSLTQLSSIFFFIVIDTCTLIRFERWNEEAGCQARKTLHYLQVREFLGIIFLGTKLQ
jgi:hypothetical protein